jgi:50S ribosomal protein L16 3-hydroxylase
MSDLKTLLAPLPPARFLSQHWARRSFVSHAAPARFPELFRDPALQTPAGLLAAPAGEVALWWEDGKGRVRRSAVGPAEALRRFRRDGAGRLTVVVDQLQLPVLDDLMQRLGDELGSPFQQQACRAQLERAGRRAGLRFSHQELFVVQVSGRGRWRFAPNRQVPSPTQSYFGGPLPPELGLCARRLPGRMPARSRQVTLRPGSVLFLPRGTWHQSEALQDSLTVGLAFPTLNWIDVLTGCLRARLVTRPEWRAIASGLLGPGRVRAGVDAQLLDLARGLGGELQALRPRDFRDRASGTP